MKRTKARFRSVLSKLFATGYQAVQLFVSGTAYQQIAKAEDPAKYRFSFIENTLLSVPGSLRLINRYAEKCGADKSWIMCSPFVQLIIDLDGLPRPLYYLCQMCFGERLEHGKEFFEGIFQVNFDDLYRRMAQRVQETYGTEGFASLHKEAAYQIIKHSLLALPVSRDTMLGDMTVAVMEEIGHVFLEPTLDGMVLFRLPVLFIYLYNQVLDIVPQRGHFMNMVDLLVRIKKGNVTQSV